MRFAERHAEESRALYAQLNKGDRVETFTNVYKVLGTDGVGYWLGVKVQAAGFDQWETVGKPKWFPAALLPSSSIVKKTETP
jgi:hypothetical protein